MPAVHHPWVLGLICLSLLPWFWPAQKAHRQASLMLAPADAVSIGLDRALRLAASLAVFCLILGLADPYRPGQPIERVGAGARIVLLVDRSSSMGENFSGRYLGGSAHESKGVAAQHFLAGFVTQRPNDLFAMIDFSGAPMLAMPMTGDHVAIQAAIAALTERGHGITHIAPALALALDTLGNPADGGSRIVLLVSDGATRIDEDTRERIRRDFQERDASLYWVYLRTPKSTRLSEPPANPGESTTPEYFLHRYFQQLGVSYRAFEAENPGALEAILTELSALKPLPWHYTETPPESNLSAYCYALALVLTGVTATGFWLEHPALDDH